MNQLSDRKTSKSHVELFQLRESTWTVVYRTNDHIKSAYNLIASIFTFYVLSWIFEYIFNWKEFQEDVNYSKWATKKSYYIFIMSTFYYVCSAIQWTILRMTNKPCLNFWILQIPLITLYTYLPNYLIMAKQLNGYITFAILTEQIRVAMKMYSFTVENFSLPISSRAKYSHFTYFWFSPTLIYRPAYPMAKTRSWRKVLFLFLQFCCCVYILFSCCRRFVQTTFQDVAINPIKITHLPSLFSSCFMIGMIIIFSGWFGLLHCWLNMWAEALKFGDRLFYESWWLSITYPEWHRTWNRVVYLWLHTYTYKPLSKSYGSTIGVILTILISSFFHEYVMCISIRAFFPIMSILYVGNGIWLFFLTQNLRSDRSGLINGLILASVLGGYTIFVALYPLEAYSRMDCPPISKNPFIDFFIPRCFSCVKFVA